MTFTEVEELYAAFNSRDVETLLRPVHPHVDWANGWESGRVIGRGAVGEYWLRQWEQIDPKVSPVRIEVSSDNVLRLRVHQTVRGRDGALLAENDVVHVYRFEDGLIKTMDIEETG